MEEAGSIGCQKNSRKKKAGIETSMDKLSWITQPKKKTNKQKQSQSQRLANSE
jgi:hypothetical protein